MSQTAAGMLAKAGRDAAASNAARIGRSTTRRPRRLRATAAPPTALHNNCSGKHAGFVCLACGLGEDPRATSRPTIGCSAGARPRSKTITGASSRRESRHRRLLDPDLRHPAARAGLGFARFGTGHGMLAERAKAARAHPRGGGGASLHGRRERAIRHRDDEAVSRARLRQGGRRRRLLRRPAGTRLRHRAEMR